MSKSTCADDVCVRFQFSVIAKACFSITLGLLLTVNLAFGQAEAGSISGTIKDATGAVITGATVKAKSVATGSERSTKTGTLGQFSIPSLTPGNYQVTISADKFQTNRTTTVVTVGGITTVDAQLIIGSSSVVVDVVGETGTQVNTETQELSQLINTQQVASLPSLTRNIYDFVALSGNVSNGDSTSNSSGSTITLSGQNINNQGVGYSINGQREVGTEILLDGVENAQIFTGSVGEQVPVDAVQEYSIVTSNFAAEYGRASGGVVNVTTKSGSNSFHGSAWEFNRLSAYTANTYDNVALDLPKGVYTRNMFGFNVGGPLIKNKLFFSETTEWTRVRSAAIETELIPTTAFLGYTAPNVQSYFGAFGATPYQSQTGTTYNQAALGVSLPGVPAATPILQQVSFAANADAGGDYPQNAYRILGRVDYNLSDKTQMFARFGQENQLLFPGQEFYGPYPQYDVGTAINNDSGLFSVTHTFNSYLFTSSKLSISRLTDPFSYNAAAANAPELVFGNASFNGLQITFPGVANDMLAGAAGGVPFGGPQNTIQFEQDVAWTKGKHNMRFGGQFTYLQLNIPYGAYAQADEYLGTGVPAALSAMMTGTLQYYETAINPQGQIPCQTYPDGAEINPASCSVTPPVTQPSFSRSYRYKDWALYAQDSFRATPRLTLNYGLRYEHYGVQHDNHQNLDSNLYYGSGANIFQQVASGTVETGTQSSIGQLWAPRWGTPAPRVGFAYDVFGNGDTSVRGGFGISYERNFGNVTYNMIQNVPAYGVLEAFTVPVTNSNLGTLGAAGPSVPLAPVELRNVNEHINVAQTQFWSLSLEHKVARNTIVAAEYSGAHGVHLYDVILGNPIGGAQEYLGQPLYTGTDPSDPLDGLCNTYTNPYTGAGECYSRPNSRFAGVNVRGSNGDSSYNSLNLKFQTQNLHDTGLSMVANFTWSHSLDDLSSTFSADSQGGSGYIGNLGYLDPLDPKLDWGSSDFDISKRIVIAPIWELPWFKSGRGVTTEALGGWSLTGVFTARTGVPFSAYDYTYNLNSYGGVPRIVPSTPITSFKATSGPATGPNQFLLNTIPGPNDLAPFNTTLGISDFGPFPSNMIGRNAFRGPGAWNTDMSLGKKFKLTERFGLDFRAEGFNVFNHHNLYVDEPALSEDNLPSSGSFAGTGVIGPALPIIGLKGGLNTIALGGNHDERRFGQFSLRLNF
jgi:hypothetical protein